MAKIDKEMLRKHHFWFLFIPIALGLLIAWIGLISDVDGEVADKLKKNDAEAKATANPKVQPRKTLDVFKEQMTELDKKKLVLWKAGWERQKDVFVWPSGYSGAQLEVVKKLKWGDEIPDTNSVRGQFADPKVYPDEYKKLVDTLDPMQFKSVNPDSTRENNWKTVLVRNEQDWGKTPDSEDMWLAMEDLWVQRELLLAVHRVNVAAATLKLVVPSPDGKNDLKHRWFRNRTWELELWIDEEKGGNRVLKGKLKNVSPRLQLMGVGNVMQLEVEMKPEGKNFPFEVQETSLDAGKTMAIKTVPGHSIPADMTIKEIAGVRQIFDARTIPVKRIDAVALGQKCDRNNYMPLRASLMSLKRINKSIKDRQAIASATGVQVATPDPAAPPPPSDDPAAAVVLAPPTGEFPTSQDNLRRYRYLDVIAAKAPGEKDEVEQMRRLPVGMVLVTDQSYVNDILESLVNIKLPLQLVQVESVRFHDSLDYKPNTPTSPISGPASLPAAGPNPYGTSPTNSRDDQFSANLMQLSIYGVISLYDPYQEKPAKK